MAKKVKQIEVNQAVLKNKPEPKNRFQISKYHIIPLLTCLLYFGIHFIPDLGAYDNFGPQWLFLIIVDILITAWILSRKDDYKEATWNIFNNIFSRLYILFFLLAGLSIFYAINPTEGWVCFVRIIATIIAFFNISILLHEKTDLVPLIFQMLGLIMLFESLHTISLFINGIGNLSNYEIIMSLKGYAGNKNIFAAGLVVKIPFVIYCIHTSKFWGKVLNIFIFILGCVAIFIVNSRASYVSLFVITLMYLAFTIINYRQEKNLENTIYKTGSVIIPLIMAFIIAQLFLTNIADSQDATDVKYFGTVTERLSTVTEASDASNQVRLRLWKHAIDYTINHPVFGCGIGNWKIASIPYQKTITNELIIPVHAHNDFLEIFAELGILGGLVYVCLFASILFLTYKTFTSKAHDDIKLISVFTLMAFAAYSIDAFFNFPIERPVSQMFFVLIAAINVHSYLATRDSNVENSLTQVKKIGIIKSIYGTLALLLLIPAFYVSFLTYKSLIVQRTVLGDLNNEPLKLDWKEITASLPAIPNLSATGQPIEAIKGRYVYEAAKYKSMPEKYADAIVLLDKGRSANPVIGYSEFLKAGVYFSIGKYDSAKTNAITAFYTRPRAKTYFQTLIAILAHLKDTTEIKRAYAEAKLYRQDVYVWNLYLQGMINSLGKGTPHLLKVVDSSLVQFPADSTLLTRKNEILRFMENTGSSSTKNVSAIDYATSQKYYAQGVAAFGKGVAGQDDLEKAAGYFLKAAAINPADYTTLENAAICYFNLKNWNKSIEIFNREMSMVVSTTGKPEYFKGIALINIGQKEQGCTLLKVALSKGWKDAEGIINGNCM